MTCQGAVVSENSLDSCLGSSGVRKGSKAEPRPSCSAQTVSDFLIEEMTFRSWARQVLSPLHSVLILERGWDLGWWQKKLENWYPQSRPRVREEVVLLTRYSWHPAPNSILNLMARICQGASRRRDWWNSHADLPWVATWHHPSAALLSHSNNCGRIRQMRFEYPLHH